MYAFSIIVALGLIYAACAYDANLLLFFGIAITLQIIVWLLKSSFYKMEEKAPTGDQNYQNLYDFMCAMKFSPWSKFFNEYSVKGQLEKTETSRIVAVYRGIMQELIVCKAYVEADPSVVADQEYYVKNLQTIVRLIRAELVKRKIENHKDAPKKQAATGNWAAYCAGKFDYSRLWQESLSVAEISSKVKAFSDEELVAVVLDTPKEILHTTSEYATGKEEEAEAHYHNNLRKIERVIRDILAKRMLGDKTPVMPQDTDDEN